MNIPAIVGHIYEWLLCMALSDVCLRTDGDALLHDHFHVQIQKNKQKNYDLRDAR